MDFRSGHVAPPRLIADRTRGASAVAEAGAAQAARQARWSTKPAWGTGFIDRLVPRSVAGAADQARESRTPELRRGRANHGAPRSAPPRRPEARASRHSAPPRR